jgi:8-oxo-dGTP pyrophosphatase MutT (NUDIX family)
MHRHRLIALLERYAHGPQQNAAVAARFLDFVGAHDDCLLRQCVPGHITASAWIWSPDHRTCLLTHHRKLDRWLQLGGHVDGEGSVQLAALREAQEESGMERFQLLSPGGRLAALDLDVHTIPAHKDEPEHLHWDVRFLLRAEPLQELVLSAESKALRWLPRQELLTCVSEESVVRLERHAAEWEQRRGADALAACPLPQ